MKSDQNKRNLQIIGDVLKNGLTTAITQELTQMSFDEILELTNDTGNCLIDAEFDNRKDVPPLKNFNNILKNKVLPESFLKIKKLYVLCSKNTEMPCIGREDKAYFFTAVERASGYEDGLYSEEYSWMHDLEDANFTGFDEKSDYYLWPISNDSLQLTINKMVYLYGVRKIAIDGYDYGYNFLIKICDNNITNNCLYGENTIKNPELVKNIIIDIQERHRENKNTIISDMRDKKLFNDAKIGLEKTIVKANFIAPIYHSENGKDSYYTVGAKMRGTDGAPQMVQTTPVATDLNALKIRFGEDAQYKRIEYAKLIDLPYDWISVYYGSRRPMRFSKKNLISLLNNRNSN